VQPTGGVKSVTNKFPDSQRIFAENAELVLLTKPKTEDCTIHDEEPESGRIWEEIGPQPPDKK